MCVEYICLPLYATVTPMYRHHHHMHLIITPPISRIVEGLMYTAPACVFWLSIGSLIFETRRMLDTNAFAKITASPTLYGAAAAMGFMVNATAYLTIQLAGSLTVKVLGTVKNAVVVWLGVLLWAEPVTMLQLVGYGASIGGFALYNWHKMHGPVRGGGC